MELEFDNELFNVKFSNESFQDIEVKIFKYNNNLYKHFTFYDGDLYMSFIKGDDHGYNHQIEVLPSIFNSEKRCFQLYYLNKNDNSHHCIELHYFDDKFDIFGKYFRENTEIVLK